MIVKSLQNMSEQTATAPEPDHTLEKKELCAISDKNMFGLFCSAPFSSISLSFSLILAHSLIFSHFLLPPPLSLSSSFFSFFCVSHLFFVYPIVAYLCDYRVFTDQLTYSSNINDQELNSSFEDTRIYSNSLNYAVHLRFVIDHLFGCILVTPSCFPIPPFHAHFFSIPLLLFAMYLL